MSKRNRYTYRVFWSDEDQEFVAVTLELGPAMSWLDPDPVEALRGLYEALGRNDDHG